VAVIELGTSSIRLAIAALNGEGGFRLLDSLQMAVSLGKDTFTGGRITPATAEECVKVLRSFDRILLEYGITDSQRVTAVATSAVREAQNRDAFLDRILIATGISVRVIDPAEVNRFTYLAVRPTLERESFWKRADTLVIEVGGGSTDALMFRRGRVETCHLYRFGSLRVRESLEQGRLTGTGTQEVMQSQVDQTVAQIVESIAPVRSPHMVVLGADARFACSRLCPEWDRRGLARMPVPQLARWTAEILEQSADTLVRRHRISYPDAETLGPALLVYARLARALTLHHVLVAETSLRNGVLAEISGGGSWTEDFERQLINSADALGRHYAVNREHAEYVARMSRQLFQVLQGEHHLDHRYALILTVAALLHETGLYISRSSHHKHSMYVIINSDLFGLGFGDVRLTALVARYHRRAVPQPLHEHYGDLDRDERIKVQKLAAILRVADALDCGHAQRLQRVDMAVEGDTLVLRAREAGSLALEQHRMREKAALFTQVYGMPVHLRGT
jgi:exopolyphosphatase/guanosine-5'-triphosphate,3'-diphosphate pyrophosphatase